MALTPEQLEEVRRELAARMGGDSTFKNPRTEGAGFMGFGTKTDPLLGNPAPSDNLVEDAAGNTAQKSEFTDAGDAARQGYQSASAKRSTNSNDALSNALKNYMPSGGGEQQFAPSGTAETPGTDLMDSTGSFGSFGNSTVDAGAAGGDIGSQVGNNPNLISGGNGNLMDSSQPFGGGESAGGSWGGAALGALAGMNQGHQNYLNDPNMRSGQDGYGKYHRDYRAEVGGGFLGGVLGYYGGPVGAAFAGPAVKLAHPYAERGTREVMNFGDKVGGESGSLALDPIGTMASGKYSWGDLGKGALLGPAKKWFNL